jgi:hypothetical protein
MLKIQVQIFLGLFFPAPTIFVGFFCLQANQKIEFFSYELSRKVFCIFSAPILQIVVLLISFGNSIVTENNND